MNQETTNNGVLNYIHAETIRTGHGISYMRLMQYFDKIIEREELNESLKQLINQSKIRRYENPTGNIYTTNF